MCNQKSNQHLYINKQYQKYISITGPNSSNPQFLVFKNTSVQQLKLH